MRYRLLGRTGLFVSEICLGTMTYGGKGRWAPIGQLGVADAQAQIKAAFDAGVNFIDTANVYSQGVSEEITGRAIAGKRDRIVLATKARFPMGSDTNAVGSSRRNLRAACEASLTRLGTDWIDLYQVHCWDKFTPLEETLSTLSDLVHEGKVRYIGASNFAAWHLMKALGLSARPYKAA
jgi:aryl-alcohol dehydrogenase-like predicted oxidoreductase